MMKKKKAPATMARTVAGAAAGAVAGDLGLPEEPLLGSEEAAEAVREARRISGRPAPKAPEAEEAVPEPEPLIPWGPLRPDEIPS